MAAMPIKSFSVFLILTLSLNPCSFEADDSINSELRTPYTSRSLKNEYQQKAAAIVRIDDSVLQGWMNSELPEVVGSKDLGGNSASPPCCLASGEGVHDCFIRGKDSSVYHMHIGSEEHPGWVDMDVFAVGDLACFKLPDGSDLLLAINRNGCLKANKLVDGQWQGWKKTGAVGLTEVPSCAAINANKIDCLYRGIGGKSYKQCYWWGKWMPPMCYGGVLSSPIGCHKNKYLGLECFSASIKYRLQSFWGVSLYLAWRPLKRDKDNDVRVQDRPCVISHEDGEKEVYARGLDNEMVRRSWTKDGRINNWEIFGGELGSAPACVRLDHGHVACFAVNYVSYFMFNYFGGCEWSGWKHVEVGMDGPPSCFRTGMDRVNCYVRGAMTASIYEVKFQF